MKNFWKNNKGASLILVIGCVALLSVVGSMLLMVTMNNREMKELEQEIQNTFYQAESGSDQLMSALERKAEDVLGKAFADMMVNYASYATDKDRDIRISEYFAKALETGLTATDGDSLMSSMLGSGVTVQSVTIGGVSTEDDPDIDLLNDTDIDRTKIVKLSDVQIKYTDADGNSAMITTDIKVQAGVPDLESSLSGSAAYADFTDFAMITNGNIVLDTSVGGSAVVKIDGNLYTAGDTVVAADDITLQLQNAEKVLIKNDLKISQGKVTVNNTPAGGYGVWANGIEIGRNGVLEGTSNFYLADDLTLTEDNGRVTISGDEFVGYSGNTVTDPKLAFEGSSAITINDSENITVDLSGIDNLVLSGMSYIYENGWSTSVLQGESLAYKEMQALYLVPSSLIQQSNPCLVGDSADMPTLVANAGTLDYYYMPGNSSKVLHLANYVDAAAPFVTIDVMMEGGTTQYRYVYLKFKSQADAAEYVKDYMATELGDDIRSRITGLGATSEIKLATHNYAAGTLLQYTGGTLSQVLPDSAGTSYQVYMSNSAKIRRQSLFTGFRLNGTNPADWSTVNVLADAVLSDDVVTQINNAPTVSASNFHSYTGDTTLDGTPINGFVVVNGNLDLSSSNITGIVLVNGNVTVTGTGSKVNGLIVATGEVKFEQMAEFTKNKAVVDALLEDENVKKFFRVSANAEDANGFISTEAVSVKFENWTRN
ncbi:MAG: hypothetical protein IJW37_00030 [Lachnospiraceae bacterium]|nr:hypothetical protein [Lachnospiraceae bacterium]